MKKMMLVAAVGSIAMTLPVMAQGRGRGNDGIPPGQRPPAGLCRVWIDGVPPGRQPAPTDCATAVATRPANSRVIYGSGSRNDRSNRTIYNSNGTISSGNRGVYDPNGGGVYGNNRGIYNGTSNGSVIYNGQNCVQRTDVYGQVRTYCDGSSASQRGVYGNTSDVRRDRDRDADHDRDDDHGRKGKHKHKHKGHDDDDRN